MNKKRNSGAPFNPVIKDDQPDKSKLDYDLKIREFPWSEKQMRFLELAEDKETKLIILKGPAGTAKTLLAAYSGLQSLNEHKTTDIIYLRQPVESSTHNIGYLKGSLSDKMSPYTRPLCDKLEELLPVNQAKRLHEDERISSVPIGFLRGLSFNNSFVILDEAQNLPFQDFLTVLTRIGQYSKAIVCGDLMQSDIRNSAFERIYNGFDTDEAKANGIQTFAFDSSDIFRSPVLGFILETMEKIKTTV